MADMYAEDFIDGQKCPLLVEGSETEPCTGHLRTSCDDPEAPLQCDACHWEVEDLSYD